MHAVAHLSPFNKTAPDYEVAITLNTCNWNWWPIHFFLDKAVKQYSERQYDYP